MSNILDAYKTISDWKVSNIKARNIEKVNLAITKTPIRLLLPSTEGRVEFVAMGNSMAAQWTIRDLCLFAPLTQGKGVEQFAKGMVDYITGYMDKVKETRSPATNICIVDVSFQMTPMPWAEKDYWAVDTTITLREVL